MRAANAACLIVALAGGSASSAKAAVLVKTIRVTICVTDVKHPDGCKNIAADGHVVVSEDALAGLMGELGQGATIMQATGPAPPLGERPHRRHGGGAPSP